MTDAIISVTETKTAPESSTSTKSETSSTEKQEKPQMDWEHILADVGTETIVTHKVFGEGKVSKMDKAKNIFMLNSKSKAVLISGLLFYDLTPLLQRVITHSKGG